MINSKKICVVGLGYIGLPTAALLARSGYEVVGVDLNPAIVKTINQGSIHIMEPDLLAVVSLAVKSGLLRAFQTPKPSDVYIICVPTPLRYISADPIPNLEYVETAVRDLAELLKPNDLLILESSSPVGTTENVSKILEKAGVNLKDIDIAYCPERVLPGRIMQELVDNNRIVGGLTARASTAAAKFYRTFVRGDVIETSARLAEMCKLAENSFRDVNIAFANELSILCEKESVDVRQLIQLANRHPRVNILEPGCGVGGHCIAVDPWFIVASNPENSKLIRTARMVNDGKAKWVVNQIKLALVGKTFKNGSTPTIACFGLAFKADVDDLRESPALEIVEALNAEGYDIMVVEPNIQMHEKLNLVEMEEAFDNADVLVFLVRHKQFLTLLKSKDINKKIALDFCGAIT
jgi:UDP-N-acetyl-D-mannosaminuronic acid dehydrogenase